jgi:hypothetical protein
MKRLLYYIFGYRYELEIDKMKWLEFHIDIFDVDLHPGDGSIFRIHTNIDLGMRGLSGITFRPWPWPVIKQLTPPIILKLDQEIIEWLIDQKIDFKIKYSKAKEIIYYQQRTNDRIHRNTQIPLKIYFKKSSDRVLFKLTFS